MKIVKARLMKTNVFYFKLYLKWILEQLFESEFSTGYCLELRNNWETGHKRKSIMFLGVWWVDRIMALLCGLTCSGIIIIIIIICIENRERENIYICSRKLPCLNLVYTFAWSIEKYHNTNKWQWFISFFETSSSHFFFFDTAKKKIDFFLLHFLTLFLINKNDWLVLSELNIISVHPEKAPHTFSEEHRAHSYWKLVALGARPFSGIYKPPNADKYKPQDKDQNDYKDYSDGTEDTD